MATKTSAQVEQELNDLLYESTVNEAPWTQVVKRRAINRAIRGSWPYFKIPQYDATMVLLAAGTYVYSLSTIADIEDLGGYAVCQVYVEPGASTTDDWKLLRSVTQEKSDTTWRLHVPEEIVNAYAGFHLRLHYYARVHELDWSGGAADVLDTRFCNYVIHKAAVFLMRIILQGGSDFNVDVYPQLLKDCEAEAGNELHNNVVYQIPCMVGVRLEGAV